MKKQEQKGWTWREWLVVAFIALNIGAKMCTIYVTTNVQSLTTAANQIEADSGQRFLQQLGYVQFLAQGVLYGVIVALYLWIRKRYGSDSTAMNLMVLTFFVIAVMDFSNDLAYVLAIIR